MSIMVAIILLSSVLILPKCAESQGTGNFYIDFGDVNSFMNKFAITAIILRNDDPAHTED